MTEALRHKGVCEQDGSIEGDPEEIYGVSPFWLLCVSSSPFTLFLPFPDFPSFPDRPEDIPKDRFIGDILANRVSESLADVLMNRIEEENKYRRLILGLVDVLSDPQQATGLSPDFVQSVRTSALV